VVARPGSGPVFRTSFEFSPDGGHAACVATDGTGGAWLEGWTLTGSGPRRRVRSRPTGDPARWRPLPLAGDRVLLQHEYGGLAHLTLLGTGGELASRPDPYRSVAAAPPDHGLALGLVETPAGTTEVCVLGDDLRPTGRVPAAVAPGRLRGPGVVVGDWVAFHALVGSVAKPVVVDLAAGRADRLPLPPEVRGAVPVCAAGDTLLAGVRVGEVQRLALLRPFETGGLTLLTGLDQLTGSVQPLALDPAGAELVLRVRTGIRSRLLRHRLVAGTTSEIAAPAGIADPVAGWCEQGLWLPYTSTTAPTSLWWLPPGQDRLRRGPVRPPPGSRPGRVSSFDGPAGPVEAVVYGDWRRDSLVVALHGGPAAHWPLAFDAGLQALAAAGLAVVAPNPRGSTGYGRRYEQAIIGDWGGPDLADVVAVGAHLARVRGGRRPPPALWGASYGAFLALLALAEAPSLWSGCVAIAPFRSARRLYAEAGPRVCALLDRLDGPAAGGGRRPVDLVRRAARMRGRILLLHGAADPTIPVRHSRELAAALAGVPGVAVTYHELAGGGHQPVRPSRNDPYFAGIVRFLGGTVPAESPDQDWR
jgi:alpha-beta hydrolase superfamily lysophospholipase